MMMMMIPFVLSSWLPFSVHQNELRDDDLMAQKVGKFKRPSSTAPVLVISIYNNFILYYYPPHCLPTETQDNETFADIQRRRKPEYNIVVLLSSTQHTIRTTMGRRQDGRTREIQWCAYCNIIVTHASSS